MTPMYQCKSIWNGETNQIENCTCGRCEENLQDAIDETKKQWFIYGYIFAMTSVLITFLITK